MSEENGMLISAMLRQYFMSLTVLAKWKGWGPSLDRHWYVSALSSYHFAGVVLGLTYLETGPKWQTVSPSAIPPSPPLP